MDDTNLFPNVPPPELPAPLLRLSEEEAKKVADKNALTLKRKTQKCTKLEKYVVTTTTDVQDDTTNFALTSSKFRVAPWR